MHELSRIRRVIPMKPLAPLFIALLLPAVVPAAEIDSSAPNATPAELVDALNAVFGKQTVNRAVHAKGLVVDGTFTPTAEAAKLSRAPHFATKVSVIARFSDFAGVPNVPDADPLASPRGLALKFHLPDGSDTDLVTHSFNGFPTRTADEFRQFLLALASSGPGVTKPTPADKYLAAHPIAASFLQTQPPPPVSYGTISYFGVNAFKFTNTAGAVVYGRYRIEPASGNQFLTKTQIASADANYLATELVQRLSKAPIRFEFFAQIAEAADPLDDPSIAWPETRKRVKLGTLEFTRVVPDSTAKEQALLFLPLSLPPGIEAEDPMLKARSAAYPVSYARRHQP
jgi:catalase